MDERLGSRGNIRFRFAPLNGFANPYWPTVAELNAGQELEAVTLWDSFEIGAQASETSDTASIKAKSVAARRGAANFGGSSSFWYPGDHTDMTNLASLVYAIFKELNQPGYIYTSVDGEIGDPGQPPADFTFEDGDYVSMFRIMTDEWEDVITGEEAFNYNRNFLPNGMLRTYTVASTAAPVLTITGTATGAVGAPVGLQAQVNGRDWTRGVSWSSDDTAIATVSGSGVVTGVFAGPVDINATLPRTSPVVTLAEVFTVS